jgi:acyl-coenzyme A synthetase/AMP-(fatty) acid ligase
MPAIKPSELTSKLQKTNSNKSTHEIEEITNASGSTLLRALKKLNIDGQQHLILRPDESYPTALGDREIHSLISGKPSSIGMYTSGSTGKPRLHFQSIESLKLSTRPSHPGRAWGLLYSPSRMAGIQVVFQCHASDAVLVEPEPGTTTEQFLDECIIHGVDSLSATPSRWRSLLGSNKTRDLALKYISIGGEIADQNLLDKLRTFFPEASVRHIYAMTETGPVFSVADGLEGFPSEYLARGLASGKRLTIVEGELVVSYDLHGQVKSIQTGDLVVESGNRVRFMGRTGDIVNIGGVKVSLSEVERICNSFPGVVDSQARAIKSPFMGSLISLEIAWEGSAPKDSQIRSHFQKHLPKAAIPAVITSVDSLELSENFKKRRKT